MEKIIFEIQWKMEDFKKVSYWNALVRKKATIILGVLVFVAGICALIFQAQIQFPVVVSILLLLYPFALVGTAALRISGYVKTIDPAALSKRTIVVEEQGVISRDDTDGSASLLTWDRMEKAYEIADYFVFLLAMQDIVFFPKRDMDEKQIADMREYIKKYMDVKRIHIKNNG